MNETGAPRAVDRIEQENAERIFRAAATRYIAARRARIEPFVRSHFGLAGAYQAAFMQVE